MDKQDIILSIKNLTVKLGSETVLKNVNLNAGESEFIGIVGKSGCGKTTLLNAIAGFIDFDGSLVKPNRIGFVFQDYSVFPWLTVEENISFSIADPERIQYYLKSVELEDKKDEYPYVLSGGQRQRLALARALAADPELVLMDEPFGSLDIYTRENMQKWLLDIWRKEKKTILFVTHSVEEAILLSDRVLVINDDQIVGRFNVNLQRPRNEEIKFSEEFINLHKRINQKLKD